MPEKTSETATSTRKRVRKNKPKTTAPQKRQRRSIESKHMIFSLDIGTRSVIGIVAEKKTMK